MKKLILIFLIYSVANTCFSQSLSPAWVSDSLFRKPESALFDSVNQIIYVSNINGEYLAKDTNGFISQIKPNGDIVKLKWVEGLDNPQGLGMFNNALYVADINRVVQINANTATIENVYVVDSALFLNDIATDKNGDVYISDCFGNKIYKISNNKIEIWFDSEVLSGPNGLFCTDNAVLFLNANENKAYSVSKSTKKLTEIFSGISNMDGIVSETSDAYFVSGSWQGQIFYVDFLGNKKLLLDFGNKKIIAADIEYIREHNLLIIPTLDKTVLGYVFSK